MKQNLKKAWGVVNTALIVVVAVLAIALAGVKLVGLDVYVILSGSMEPEYQTGGVIYIKDVDDTSTLQSGDVITYTISNGATVTHRIVDVIEENGQTMYQTKGDANENVDASLVPQNQIIGQPVFTIPYLGYLVSTIQSQSGKFVLIAVAAILLLMQFLPDLIFGEDDDDDEEVEKKKKHKRRDKKGSGTQPESATKRESAPLTTAAASQHAPAAQSASSPVPTGNQKPAVEPVITESGNQPAKPASLTTAPEAEPATAPESPAPDSLQSFLEMDPDEFFNKLINNSKEEGK